MGRRSKKGQKNKSGKRSKHVNSRHANGGNAQVSSENLPDDDGASNVAEPTDFSDIISSQQVQISVNVEQMPIATATDSILESETVKEMPEEKITTKKEKIDNIGRGDWG